jgi:hypothetical protein
VKPLLERKENMNEDEIVELLDYHKNHYGEWSTLSNEQRTVVGEYFSEHQYEEGVFEAEREVTAYGVDSWQVERTTALNYERIQDVQAGISD